MLSKKMDCLKLYVIVEQDGLVNFINLPHWAPFLIKRLLEYGYVYKWPQSTDSFKNQTKVRFS